ncbi:hypothetical protein GGI07_003512 [Coemansia sp. Benny D115]|nr:hypothetical protein GGI07_003512 [Coemansia sp. Benny D115]
MANLVANMRALPPATKATMGATALVSLTSMCLRYATPLPSIDGRQYRASEDPARIFLLRPALLRSHPWTLLTTALVECNVLLLIYALLVLATVGAFLERQWGTAAYLRFLAIMAVVPVAVATVAVCLLYAVRGDATVLYVVPVGGMAAVLTGFTVGLKQLVPEHSVKLLRGRLGFRVNDLPGFYTLVFPLLFTLIGDVGGAILVNVGFVVSFVYLRFYKREQGVMGDRSVAFAFATFFPPFVQPVIRRVSSAVYAVAVRCRLITSEADYLQQHNMADLEAQMPPASASEPAAASAGDGVDAELDAAGRRQALASRVPDQRAASAGNSTPAASS